ncbi:leucyl aminopeptidase [Streptomyces capparidis]
MPALRLVPSAGGPPRADALVVGVTAGGRGPVVAPGGQDVDRAFGGHLAAVLTALGARGEEDELHLLPSPPGLPAPVVAAAGLGPGHGPEALRRAAGTAARALAGRGTVALLLPCGDPAAVDAVAQGALLGGYAFTAYRTGPAAGPPPGEVLVVCERSGEEAFAAAAARAAVVAAEVNRARDLVNAPPGALTPPVFAALAEAAGAGCGVDVAVLDERALADGGYGGIVGVGRGSAAPPRLVRLGYAPHPGRRSALAFVGKGITYDSGGISLKRVGQNETMKYDMAGAAAVLCAVLAVAGLGLPVNVTGWLALAENMPSGTATRPGDVLRMYAGTTVEVRNTDAEGRLVLADAMARAAEERPRALVDVATLTGAVMVALGRDTFGIMGSDDAFRDAVHAAAGEAGEPSWPLPLPPELRAALDSDVADLANTGAAGTRGKAASALIAGHFLRRFAPAGVPWAHLDIAGPAYNPDRERGHLPRGGTGAGVATLVRLAERAAAEWAAGAR